MWAQVGDFWALRFAWAWTVRTLSLPKTLSPLCTLALLRISRRPASLTGHADRQASRPPRWALASGARPRSTPRTPRCVISWRSCSDRPAGARGYGPLTGCSHTPVLFRVHCSPDRARAVRMCRFQGAAHPLRDFPYRSVFTQGRTFELATTAVQWSITTSTQWLRSSADSHRNRSRLQALNSLPGCTRPRSARARPAARCHPAPPCR